MLQTTRVLVADSSASFLMGTIASLSQLPQIAIVGYATSGDEAIRLVELLEPDVFVFEAEMLSHSQRETLGRLREGASPPRLVLTSHDVNEGRSESLRTMGADVFFNKDEIEFK